MYEPLRRTGRRLIRRLRRAGSTERDPASMQAQALVEEVGSYREEGELGPVRRSSALYSRSIDDLAAFIEELLANTLQLPVVGSTRQHILDFFELRKRNPVPGGVPGTTGDAKNFWLHLIARSAAPGIIVESGVFRGRSLYTLRRAVPGAELHAFDITFDSLSFRDPGIQYHERDWSEVDLEARERVGMCYFDDHINNGRRIREAYTRGFRHLIFDDCPRTGMLHRFRYPGVPTALMIAHDRLTDGDVLEWKAGDTLLRYSFRVGDTHGAEALIELARRLPSLEDWIGESAGQLAYVRLKAQ